MYTININFDEASIEWRKNKKYIGSGYFIYKCNHLKKNGSYCKNKIYQNGFCKYHILS
jgi:hypothetical protein